jgi:FkbM family methyltransferase
MSVENFLPQNSPIVPELRKLFSADTPLTIFEIGSCDGTDAIRYGKAFPNAKVFAFEPVPSNVEKIQKNISEQKPGNVTAFGMAMSESVGEAAMHISSANVSSNSTSDDAGNKSSSLLAPDKHLEVYPWCKFDNTLVVKTDTIQNFCNTHSLNSIDFIHLDVQGAELMVLKGAGDFIRNINAIWLEVEHIALYKDQPLHQDIESFMQRHGFILTKFRVGGFSGDQLYVNKEFIKKTKGSSTLSLLEFKSSVLRSSLFIAVNRYLRKLRFLVRS